MRILVGADVPPNPDSGAAGTVYATNVALRALGHEVDEIWTDDLDHRIRHWNLHYLLELPRSYMKVVAAKRSTRDYDVVQLSQPYAWMAARDHQRRRRHGLIVNRSHGLESMANVALSEWHRRLGVPENQFPRSMLSPMLRWRLHRHIDLVARYADGIIVPASDIREHLVASHGADPARVEVIPHGVPDDFLAAPQRPMSAARLRRMLYVGQFSFIKGPRLLASAAAAVLEADREASLSWVCGSDAHEQVRAMFHPELRDRVHLLDWMPQQQLLELYDQHGIHLAHSLYEGAAKACAEAMARGQIVVATRVGALKDHINSGQNGFLVDVGDTDSMARAALSVIQNPAGAARIGAAAVDSSRARSWRNCANSAVAFYQRLLNHSERGSR